MLRKSETGYRFEGKVRVQMNFFALQEVADYLERNEIPPDRLAYMMPQGEIRELLNIYSKLRQEALKDENEDALY